MVAGGAYETQYAAFLRGVFGQIEEDARGRRREAGCQVKDGNNSSGSTVLSGLLRLLLLKHGYCFRTFDVSKTNLSPCMLIFLVSVANLRCQSRPVR
jgi:hypothetical protein